MTTDTLLVSVIVCTLNEERFIGPLLDSLLAQENVPGRLEVIVVDGGSKDGTLEIVRARAETADVFLLENKRGFHVYGFNDGARAARGEYLAYVGAHAIYGPNYISSCLETLHRTGAANVGAVVRHAGHGTVGAAIAIAMSSPFGVGDSKFRQALTEQDCDSVMGGFLAKRVFNELGGFNETNLINQDGEFNYRLRRAGYRIVVSPAIETTYYVRSSFGALAKQYLRYGYYRRWTEVQHPGSVPIRVYAPALLVAGTTAGLICYAISRRRATLLVPVAYAVFLAAALIYGLRRSPDKPRVAALVPAAVAVMHFAYGWGWLFGFFKFPFAKGLGSFR